MSVQPRDRRRWFAAHFGNSPFSVPPLQSPFLMLGLALPLVAVVVLAAIAMWSLVPDPSISIAMAGGPGLVIPVLYDLAKLHAERKTVLQEMGEIDRSDTAAKKNYLENPRFVELDTRLKKLNGDIEAGEAIETDRQRRQDLAAKGLPEPEDVRSKHPDKKGVKGPFRSLGEQMQAVIRAEVPNNPQFDQRLAEFRAPTGMGEAIGEDGGFMVQTDFTRDIWKRTYETGQILSRVRRIPIGAGFNGTKIPYVAETSRVTGSRWGGVQVYRTAEAGEYQASKPKLGEWKIELEKMTGLVYLTDEAKADAPQLEALVMECLPEELRFAVEGEMYDGNGVGKCLGIKEAPCLVTVSKETSQVADTVVAENITKMRARLWGRSRPNSVWHVNQDVEPQLPAMNFKIKNVAGSENVGGFPLFMPANGMLGNDYDTLYNRPIIPLEHCHTVGDLGDVALCDWTQYVMIEKGGIDVASSIHVRFIYGEQVLRFTWRVNGRPLWASALTPKKGSNTQSPFVMLAERA